MKDMRNYDAELCQAIRRFWKTRDKAQSAQGKKTGKKDTGNRTAVTSGGHLNGFIDLIVSIVHDAGIDEMDVFFKGHGSTILPGYYRATKDWDIVVVADDMLVACIELKSQVGSFGNNFNNRTEESIGSATDLWTAYREGAFAEQARPFLGYLAVLEDCPASTRPVRVSEPHFNVFPEFNGASYEKRYCLLCTRLVRERLYDAACLLLADREQAKTGGYREPSKEISFHHFIACLWSHAKAMKQTKG